MLETTDTAAAVLAFYTAKLGMQQQSKLNMGSKHVVTFADEAGQRTLVVSADPQDGKTLVNLQLFGKKQK